MNCHDFWNNPDGADADNHLHRCATCSATWEQQRMVADKLGDFAAKQNRTEAPPQVEARLLSAFRGHVGLGSGRAQPAWNRFLTWGSAAAALVAVAFLLVQHREPEIASRPVPAAVQAADVESLPALTQLMDSESAEAAGFIPLPNAVEVDPNEEVNLIRIELPRSAMAALGFEVNADQASEGVAADVMLGHDGLARAVRFLDE